ncbi:MAG: 4a-hydroxytetrahydrobiopterin dehydratase [Albidovulum sp.]
MSSCDLGNRSCAPCQSEGTPLADPAPMMSRLHPDWRLDGARICRRFTFKGFAKAVQMANLAAWLGDKMGHHPDVGFGWGWCEVTFTSHELGGLSENDFICAARLDALVA